MIEQFGDAWELAKGNILCITTNGLVKKNGECVMGRGIAAQAKERFPALPAHLGQALLIYGNHVHWLDNWGDWFLMSFPTKHKWWEKSDLKLIERSVKELQCMFPIDDTESYKYNTKIYLPRPGCSNGGLDWKDVKPLVEILDDRFVIVERTNEI